MSSTDPTLYLVVTDTYKAGPAEPETSEPVSSMAEASKAKASRPEASKPESSKAAASRAEASRTEQTPTGTSEADPTPGDIYHFTFLGVQDHVKRMSFRAVVSNDVSFCYILDGTTMSFFGKPEDFPLVKHWIGPKNKRVATNVRGIEKVWSARPIEIGIGRIGGPEKFGLYFATKKEWLKLQPKLDVRHHLEVAEAVFPVSRMKKLLKPFDPLSVVPVRFEEDSSSEEDPQPDETEDKYRNLRNLGGETQGQ